MPDSVFRTTSRCYRLRIRRVLVFGEVFSLTWERRVGELGELPSGKTNDGCKRVRSTMATAVVIDRT